MSERIEIPDESIRPLLAMLAIFHQRQNVAVGINHLTGRVGYLLTAYAQRLQAEVDEYGQTLLITGLIAERRRRLKELITEAEASEPDRRRELLAVGEEITQEIERLGEQLDNNDDDHNRND